MPRSRIYLVVGLAAAVVYLGALANGFPLDDGHIIAGNTLVHSPAGLWRAFASPYWPRAFGGLLYRPLTVATFALDWQIGGAGWFHFVNILWHALASILVAVLAARVAGERAALLAGLVFAVHPVHVEAVAYVVGRADVMATVFTLLAAYAAVFRQRAGWSALLWGLGLLSKESAVIAPALVAILWWAADAPRPSPSRLRTLVAAWALAGGVYAAARIAVLHDATGFASTAPVFVGQSATTVRLTAVAELGDLARLLLFPRTLRVDYSPLERTAVTGVLDPRFAVGLLILAAWGALTALAWRRGRRAEAAGLAWIGLAYLPVSNLIVPIGVLMGERNLYLPSVGLALALGAAAARLPVRPLVVGATAILLAAAVRTALRVPVWRDNLHVTLSLLEDSPQSYQGHMASAGLFLETGRSDKALEAARAAIALYPLDPRPYLIGAHAALKLGRMPTADSLMRLADRHCSPCAGVYEAEGAVAASMGDSAIADTLRAHLGTLHR